MGAQLCLIQSPSSGQNGRQPGSPSRPAARDAASVGVAPASRWRSPQQCVTRRGDAPGATPDSPADGPGAARPPGSVVAGAALPGLPPRCPCSGQPPSGSPSQPPHPVQEAMTLRPPPPGLYNSTLSGDAQSHRLLGVPVETENLLPARWPAMDPCPLPALQERPVSPARRGLRRRWAHSPW